MEHSANGRPVDPPGNVGPQAVSLVEPRRLRRAKAAYTTRFVARSIAARASEGYGVLSGSDVVPRPGDVVMARVEHIGQHKAVELPDGRRATLFEGDDVIVAYGNRYAPDQFEAEVPGDLGPTDLVAAGGVAASVRVQARVRGGGHHAAPGGSADRRRGASSPCAAARRTGSVAPRRSSSRRSDRSRSASSGRR